MFKFRSAVLLSLVILLAGCNLITGIQGSGKVTSESRDVSGFTAITLSGSGELIIEQTGTESLTIEAEDNIVPLLTSKVIDGVLQLSIKDNTSISPTRPILYKLTVKELNAITTSGSGKIIAANLVADKLTFVLSGSSEVTLGGNISVQDINISGSGKFISENANTKEATVSISGSGTVILGVSDKLDVNVSGIGKIEYIGNPQLTQTISGSGQIIQRK